MTTRARAAERSPRRRAVPARKTGVSPTRKAAGIGGPNNRPTFPSIQPTGGMPGPTQQQGSDGVAGWGGYLIQGELSPELTGQNLWRTYTDVLVTTVIVAAAVRYSLNLLGGANWTAEPNPRAKNTAMAQKCADLVRDGLLEADMDLPWTTHVKKAALYRWYGFSLHNWIWRKRSDGTIVYKDLRHRPQYTIRRWNITAEGEPWQGVEQLTRQGGVYYIDRARLWYCADLTLTDSPTGVGLLRHVVEHARRLAVYEQIEGFGHNANLRGVPLGRAPLAELMAWAKTNVKDMKPEEYVDAVTSELRGFLTNHLKTPEQGLLLDSEVFKSGQQSGAVPSAVPKWAVDLLKGDDAGLPAVFNVIERINREIARVMGIEHMLMGGGDTGSLAMHADKTSMYAAFLNSAQTELSNFARNDLARPLVAANFGQQVAEDCTPILRPDPISVEDVMTVTRALLDLAQSGSPLYPGDPAVDQLRARMHLQAQPKIPDMNLPRMAERIPRAVGPVLDQTPPPGDGATPAPSGGATKPGETKPADELRAGGQDPNGNAPASGKRRRLRS